MKHDFISPYNLQRIAPAIIAAGIMAAGQAGQAVAQGKMNRRSIRFSREMYDRQRQDALTDWERTNVYNSPTQQMQRLREAGLNPHLIYGSGGATSNAAPIRSTEMQMPDLKTPDYASILREPVNTYLETKSFQAQQKLIDAQTLKILTDIDSTKLNMKQKESLFNSQSKLLENMAEGKGIENIINQRKDNRDQTTAEKSWEKTTADINKIAQDISSSMTNQELARVQIANGKSDLKTKDQARAYVREQINQMQKDGLIKDFEIKLNKSGVTKTDDLIKRLIALGLQENNITIEDIKNVVPNVSEDSQFGILKMLKDYFNK